MPTNVDKAAKAAKKAARKEACAKAKQWAEASLKSKGGSGTNVKSTNAAKSPLKPKQKKSGGGKSTPRKSTPKKQLVVKCTTTNPTETTRKTPSRASRKAAAIANAHKWHDDRQAKNAGRQAKGVGCKVPSTIKVETVYSDDEIDDELLSNEDDFKTANQGGTPAKATPTKVAHTPTAMAKGQKELVMLKHDVKNIYNRLSLLCDTNVDDAMDCS